jgi:hypothetical protein
MCVCFINCIITFLIPSLTPSLFIHVLCYNPLFSPNTLSAPSHPILSPCLHLHFLSSYNLSPHYPPSYTLTTHRLDPIPTAPAPAKIHPNTHKDHKTNSPHLQQKYTQTHIRTTKPSSPQNSSPTHPPFSHHPFSTTFTNFPITDLALNL